MEQKLRDHLNRIRNKLNIIKSHNKRLVALNYKLESLLVCFDTFSIEESKVENIKKEKRSTNSLNMDVLTNTDKIKKEKRNTNSLNMDVLTNTGKIKKDKHVVNPIDKLKNIQKPNQHSLLYTPSKESMLNTSLILDSNLQSQENTQFNEIVAKVTSNGKVNKMHIIKILGLLNTNNGMYLDDVIKSSGMSKYKCIDVLNLLLKAEPPAIRKKFEKGFIYFINYD